MLFSCLFISRNVNGAFIKAIDATPGGLPAVVCIFPDKQLRFEEADEKSRTTYTLRRFRRVSFALYIEQ